MLDIKLEDMNKLEGLKGQLGVKEIEHKQFNNVHSDINQNVAMNKINNKIRQMEIVRGDVFYVNLTGGIGSEQNNDRYCVCIQNDVGNKHSPTIIVAFFTSQLTKPKLPIHVGIEAGRYGLTKDSVLMLEQLRTLDKRRILEKKGHIDEIMMRQIDKALYISVSKLKEKTTLEKLPKSMMNYIINKIKMIEICDSTLGFLYRVKGDDYSIRLAEDEKFKEENALMYYCDKNKLNYEEILNDYNNIMGNKKDNMVAL